jgi:hypothetical protein
MKRGRGKAAESETSLQNVLTAFLQEKECAHERNSHRTTKNAACQSREDATSL